MRIKGYLGDGYRSAEYRVDSKPSHLITGTYSDHSMSPLCDGECKGNGKSQPEVRLLNEMSDGNMLLWRLQTYKYETVDLAFQTAGSADAIKYLQEKCQSTASATPLAKKQPTK